MDGSYQSSDGSNTNPSIHYRPALDGLRAIAILAVFVFHLKHEWLPGGFVGVDVFFVISGFLITSVLLRAYEDPSFSLWTFYQRRIARLFPAFFTVALSTLLGAAALYSARDLAECGDTLMAVSLSVANLKNMAQGNYFTASPDAQPFLHYWSLSIEEQYYLVFPAILWLLCRKASRFKTLILGLLCTVSFAFCVLLTYRHPPSGFYLLPSRAWELLVGSILADISRGTPWTDAGETKLPTLGSLSSVGLTLILVSFVVVLEGPTFPGFQALLPALGAAFVLASNSGADNWAHRLLSSGPMVLIGRMSYSLYLWHWPIFSFIDYRFYFLPVLIKVCLKVVLSTAGASLCFFLIESPSRSFLNRPRHRAAAFVFLVSAVVISVSLGYGVRQANYINPSLDTISQGGIAFDQVSARGTMVLMGDSHGTMYAKMAKEIAQALHFDLNVVSVAATDPLPNPAGQSPPLWLDSIAFVTRENPDIVILACDWGAKTRNGKVEMAVNELKQHAGRVVLITQPPELPCIIDRASLGSGSPPTFMEIPAEHARRTKANSLLKGLRSDNVIVVDIESWFTAADSSIRFANDQGVFFYQDASHLTDVGADLVKGEVMKALSGYINSPLR